MLRKSVAAGLGVVAVVGAGTASAGTDYAPPSHLGGQGLTPGVNQFFTDPNDSVPYPGPTIGSTEPLESDLAGGNLRLPDGLANERVFPGGTLAAEHFFDRAVWAGINAVGTDVPNTGNGWTSFSETNLEIYGLTRDPQTGPVIVDDIVCAVRFDVWNRGPASGEKWDPSKTGLLAIFYNEHHATHLAWIEFLFRRPGANASGVINTLAPQQLWPNNVYSQRIIFLERTFDKTVPKPTPKDYYGYDTPPPPQTKYPIHSGNTMGHNLICDVMPYQPVGPNDPPLSPSEEGGGGGEM